MHQLWTVCFLNLNLRCTVHLSLPHARQPLQLLHGYDDVLQRCPGVGGRQLVQHLQRHQAVLALQDLCPLQPRSVQDRLVHFGVVDVVDRSAALLDLLVQRNVMLQVEQYRSGHQTELCT